MIGLGYAFKFVLTPSRTSIEKSEQSIDYSIYTIFFSVRLQWKANIEIRNVELSF